MDDALREAARAVMTAGKPSDPDRIYGGLVCYGPSREFKNGGEGGNFGGPREKRRMLKAMGYEEAGGASAEDIRKDALEYRAIRKAERDKQRREDVGRFIQEIGSDTAAKLAKMQFAGKKATADDVAKDVGGAVSGASDG